MAMRRSLRAAAWSVAALLLAAALGSSALAARPAALGARLRAAAAASDVALSRWPLVMAHDAATVYLDRGSVLHPVHAWAKTQDSAEGVAGLLRCGARAFDWRPRLAADNRTLQMHHGDVVIEHSMGDALDAMLAWARANGSDPSGADLIVLGITDCAADDGLTGADCVAATRRELDARGIAHVSDCAELAGLSVAAAFERGRLPGQGGAILAIFDCWEQNYDPSVACSGFGGSSDGDAEVQHPADGDDGLTYTCYGDSASRDIPLRSMWAYLNRTAAAGPPTDGRLWATQALWQESAESVVVGELHGSSLLQDEQRSRLNSLLAQSIASGAWPPDPQQPLNLVEVNNVCDAGEELLYALRKRLGGVDAATRLAQPAQTNSASRARQPTALTDQELM